MASTRTKKPAHLQLPWVHGAKEQKPSKGSISSCLVLSPWCHPTTSEQHTYVSPSIIQEAHACVRTFARDFMSLDYSLGCIALISSLSLSYPFLTAS